MRASLQVLEQIQIAEPCPVAWDSMTGTERVRHCSQCKQDVYDLSTLTADEGAKLIEEASGHICVRLYRRTDGRVITKNCAAIRALRRFRNLIYRSALAAASFCGFVFAVSGCTDRPNSCGTVMGKMAAFPPSERSPKPDTVPPKADLKPEQQDH